MNSRAPSTPSEMTVADAVSVALTDLGIPVEPSTTDINQRAHGAADDGPWRGGVHITPSIDGSGLVIAWRLPERSPADPREFTRRSRILVSLNTALSHVLTVLGWDVHPWDDDASHLLVGRRPLADTYAYVAGRP